MSIQFGFVAIFAVAYPLGAAFALLNNILELRLDGHVLLTMTRRPRYSDSETIGAWMPVLQCGTCFLPCRSTGHVACADVLSEATVLLRDGV